MEKPRNCNQETELKDIISKEKPGVLCIQGKMLSDQTNFDLKYYKVFFKEGHTNYRAHEGKSIFIHEIIPYQKLTLITLTYKK